MQYYLGVDVGGTKSHALVANEFGEAIGFGSGGPGNWEVVGYNGLTQVLREVTSQALEAAKINMKQIAGAGMGLGGYDWPSQRQKHIDAIRPVVPHCALEIVNDASLGIWAGTSEGWGISVVAGTGCNCRGLSRDHQREGRMVGGGGAWSGESVGGYEIVHKAMQAVTFEWGKRGPATALSRAFLTKFGAKNLDDLVEGVYVGKYRFHQDDALLVFQVATQGDPEAIHVMRWAGEILGQMACGVIHQLKLEDDQFEVVLIGSLHDGHPMMTQSLDETIHTVAPGARLVRPTTPPVTGAVLLGMEIAGFIPTPTIRQTLAASAQQALHKQRKGNST